VTIGSEFAESRRNRLLRRVDWRFLLPDPEPGRTVCFTADADLRYAVALVSRSTADPQSRPLNDCDLAVLVDPKPATLHAAWTALRPGGVCYAEWHARWMGGLHAVRQRLEAAGFGHVRFYCPWRAPPRCRLWLPLEAPGALTYFRRRPLPFRSRIRRGIGSAVREIAALGVRLDALPRICTVAWKRGPGTERIPSPHPCRSASPSESRLADVAAEPVQDAASTWSELGLPATALHATAGNLSWMLLTGGPRTINKVVGLVFAEPEANPRLVVKLARVPESIAGLVREADALGALAALREHGLTGVPQLLFARRGSQTMAVGETPLRGVPLAAVIDRGNYRELALRATDWLADLALYSRRMCTGSVASDGIVKALDDFSQSFRTVIDPSRLRAVRPALCALGVLPSVCEQRDFAPWNVLTDCRGELAILDWESSELRGIPALDLIYFLTYLGITLDRSSAPADILRSYRAGIDPSTFVGRIHRECLSRYCQRVGLDPGSLPALRLLAWMIHARSEYRHFAADECGAPSERALRRSLFVRFWEVDLRGGAAG
jgi:hypothetical protein